QAITMDNSTVCLGTSQVNSNQIDYTWQIRSLVAFFQTYGDHSTLSQDSLANSFLLSPLITNHQIGFHLKLYPSLVGEHRSPDGYGYPKVEQYQYAAIYICPKHSHIGAV